MLFLENGGEILCIEFAIIVECYTPSLSNFAEKMEKARSESKIHNLVCKLIPNSLYGRLALKKDNTQTCISFDKEEVMEKDSYCDYKDFYVYKKLSKRQSPSNVLVAAAIAAKARIKLYRGMQAVKKSGGRLLYVDTDSIIATFKDCSARLGINLGEGVIFDPTLDTTQIAKACFASGKSYALVFNTGRTLIRLKGVKAPTMSFYRFQYSFYNKLPLILGATMFYRKNYTIHIKNINKRIDLNNYVKRIFNKDNTHTNPISF